MSTLRERLKRNSAARTLVRTLRRAAAAISPLNWELSERTLLALLRRSIEGRLHRDWNLADHPPHFGYHNYDALRIAYFDQILHPPRRQVQAEDATHKARQSAGG